MNIWEKSLSELDPASSRDRGASKESETCHVLITNFRSLQASVAMTSLSICSWSPAVSVPGVCSCQLPELWDPPGQGSASSVLTLTSTLDPLEVQLGLPWVSGLGFAFQPSALGSLCPSAAPPLVGSPATSWLQWASLWMPSLLPQSLGKFGDVWGWFWLSKTGACCWHQREGDRDAKHSVVYGTVWNNKFLSCPTCHLNYYWETTRSIAILQLLTLSCENSVCAEEL